MKKIYFDFIKAIFHLKTTVNHNKIECSSINAVKSIIKIYHNEIYNYWENNINGVYFPNDCWKKEFSFQILNSKSSLKIKLDYTH